MVLLITVSKAQKKLSDNLRARRLAVGLTQQGLARRSGVSLPTLRKFEQKGLISLESFLKLLLVLDGLTQLVAATAPPQMEFSSIDEVLAMKKKPVRKKGWRK
ncbi:MAG: helix-turn-helix domain-containing protein [Xanthomonadales bacterium]|nr:helix-turn-helix domain-containing protein [Xanthomonadales bacterium]